MGVQKVAALLDREGGSYFQEWAALFVVTGGTGGRACFYYPRLQPAASTSELRQEIEAPLFSAMLHAKLRAMPSVDPNDGETVLCYRSYFPAKTAKVVSLRRLAQGCEPPEAGFSQDVPLRAGRLVGAPLNGATQRCGSRFGLTARMLEISPGLKHLATRQAEECWS